MRLTQCQPICVFAEKVRPKGDKSIQILVLVGRIAHGVFPFFNSDAIVDETNIDQTFRKIVIPDLIGNPEQELILDSHFHGNDRSQK